MNSKRLIAMLCMAAMLISFSGCNSKKSDEGKLSSTATSIAEETTKKEEINSELKETKASSDNTDDAFDELNNLVAKDIEDTVSGLETEYEQLKSEIDTYDKYLANINKMEAFYKNVYETNRSLCVRMCEYSLNYAEVIIGSDKDNDDKYDDLDELFDNIYDDAADEIFDSIYDDIFDDMFDDFYDGILDDAYENAEYKEWSDVRSNEYDLWSDTRSDVYDDWSDFRSDVYDFWSDVRSAVWGDDIEKAEKKIEKFRNDVEKLKGDTGQHESDISVDEDESNTSDTETKTTKEDIPAENIVDGIRPEIKDALDSYEEFMDEYCAFMKKYSESPDDLSLLMSYLDYIEKYSEAVDKLDELGNKDMNDAELKYYLEVTTRVSEKLIDAAA